jgi:hypothetical protein
MYVYMQVEEKVHHNDHAVQVIKFFALDGSEEGLFNKPNNSNHNNNNNSGHNKNSTHNFSYHSSTHSTTSANQPAADTETDNIAAAAAADGGDAGPSVFNIVINESAAEKEVKFLAVDAEKALNKYDESLLKKPNIKQVRLG